jgi:sugar phosphate isomerase/epimerase
MEQPAGYAHHAEPPIYIAAKPLIAPRRPLPEVIAAALEAGADGIEFPQELVPVLMNPDDFEDFPAFLAPPLLFAQQPLFADGQVHHDALLTSVLQAHALGCRLVTFPLGAASGLTSETLDTLRAALDIASTDAPGVQVAVANDRAPTSAAGSVLPWLVERASEWDHRLGLTFDLDNWIATGIDVIKAAKELGRSMVCARIGESVVAASKLAEDAPLSHVLGVVPPSVPRVRAPHASTADHAQLVVILRELLKGLRGGSL